MSDDEIARINKTSMDCVVKRVANEIDVLVASVKKLEIEWSNLLVSVRHQETRADALTARVAEWESDASRLRTGYQGACYACEPVGMLNQKLTARVAELEQQRRWNIEQDGDDLLVCFDSHEKGEKCEWVRYTRAALNTEKGGE
jgi:hypothetical protein